MMGMEVTLKSLNEIMRDKEIEIKLDGAGNIYIEVDDFVITEFMVPFFNGDRYKITNISEGMFEIDGSVFKNAWVHKRFTDPESELSWNRPKERSESYLLLTSGAIMKNLFITGSSDDEAYEEGNISRSYDALSFVLEQRKVDFTVRKFIEKANRNHPRSERYELVYEKESNDPYFRTRKVFGFTTKNTFPTPLLAFNCLRLVGEENWKKYILELEV